MAGVPNEPEDIDVGVNCENGMVGIFVVTCGVVPPLLLLLLFEFVDAFTPTPLKALLTDVFVDGDVLDNEFPRP